MESIKRKIFILRWLPTFLLIGFGFAFTITVNISLPIIISFALSLIWIMFFGWLPYVLSIKKNGLDSTKEYIENQLYLSSITRTYSIFKKNKINNIHDIGKVLTNIGYRKTEENIYEKSTKVTRTRIENLFLPWIKTMIIRIYINDSELTKPKYTVQEQSLVVNLYIYLNFNLYDLSVSEQEFNSIFIDTNLNYKVVRRCIAIQKDLYSNYIENMFTYPKRINDVILFSNTECVNNIVNEILWNI